MKTTLYVDGLNLYHGCLKGTAFKWLDLIKLFAAILGGNYQIEKIRYFTAPIRSLSGDDGPLERQQIYLEALKKMYPGIISICEGYHTPPRNQMKMLANGADNAERDRVINALKDTSYLKISANDIAQVKVINIEEKQTDVNLAVSLVDDAWAGQCECSVVVTNDSDMAGAMRVVKERFPTHRLGIITPGERAKTSGELAKYASSVAAKESDGTAALVAASGESRGISSKFIRKIRTSDLKKSQLPDKIPGSKLHKPESWYHNGS